MNTSTLEKNFTLESLKMVLASIDIDWEEGFNESSLIGDELGMDSQEIVELVCSLEERHGIEIKDGDIVRTDTLADIVFKVNALMETDKIEVAEFEVSNPYLYSRKDSIYINSSEHEMMNSLWNLNGWEEKLPHIKKINVLYDDGYNQEFLMTVQTNDIPVTVRSIRRLASNNVIEFFQPEPPAYLLHHAGSWLIENNPEGLLVTLEHKWNVREQKLPELYPDLSYSDACKKIEDELFEHAQASLTLWKKVLEG